MRDENTPKRPFGSAQTRQQYVELAASQSDLPFGQADMLPLGAANPGVDRRVDAIQLAAATWEDCCALTPACRLANYCRDRRQHPLKQRSRSTSLSSTMAPPACQTLSPRRSVSLRE